MTDEREPVGSTPDAEWPDEPADYGVDDERGNERLHLLLTELRDQVHGGEVARREAVELLSDGVRALSDDYPEAADVTVRTAIVSALDPLFVGEGWERLEPFEF
jgi:hypothetical protein